MISHIHIKNFKSLKDISMEMSNLNLLTGINGVGKSSLIEALLLLQQSYNLRENTLRQLDLKGKWTDMGTQKEILCKSAESYDIEIAFQSDAGSEHYIFDCIYENGDKTFIGEKFIKNLSTNNGKSQLYDLRHFRYLSADRISPEEPSYSASQGELEYKDLGKKGEFCIEYLYKYGNNKCTVEGFNLVKEGGYALALSEQINAWMSFISPNIKVRTQYDSALNRYKLSYKYGTESEFTPKHVGFGITYTLPVVTAILISEPGDLVIIENPEAHLHPRAQSKLGELMAIAAQGGVQLIIETHSDHVLNGIRVATKQGKIDAEKVKIYYYAMNMQEMVADFYQIPINQEGIISYRELRKKGIEGFFDQINTDTDILLDIH